MSGFLGRWSQRKRAALRGEETVPETEAPPAPPAVEVELPPAFIPPVAEAAPEASVAAPEPEAETEEEFGLASLPPLDALHAGSDFTAFLRKGVPLALRHAALRKAWVADPLIRDYLSPLDYGWDFNTPGGLPPGFSDTLGETAEKVKELLRRAIGEPEPEAEKPELVAAAEEAEPEADAPVPVEEAAPEPEPPLLVAEVPPALSPEVDGDEAMPRRRHGGALPA
ncbi:DUF3306 domain-containing protein [Sabulicella glaciei]|uniref:DUF3306 domain-containing protein n=1 Tax=Sabulicella glaciei TaxID=2984948 RepID=A0ABT3P0P7_9PROT|nr:DUF3306 domain-containing protein [Roseococcus sp. MDT2-1-1]MCW8087961.1 DUF3306 domain-containing protein [Roseococcus sp. MDT2-1-1]